MEHNDKIESLKANAGSANASSEIDYVVDSLPDDCWKAILDQLCLFDIILLRATSNKLNKLCKKIRPFKKNFVLDQDNCAVYFVENGYLSCLKYAQQALCFDLAENLFVPAARCGQLETLKFLVEEYYRQYHQRPNNQQHEILDTAIRGKCDLDTLKYLKEDLLFTQRYFSINMVANKGDFECFKYFSERTFKLGDSIAPMTKECFDYAVQVGYKIDLPTIVSAGNVEILRYAIEKYNMDIAPNITYIAAEKSYECLKFLIEKFGSDFAKPFQRVHDIKCFKLLLDYGATYSSEIYRTAASAGLTDVIKLALELGIPRPELGDVAANAASSGNIECFKLVVENGFPVLPCQVPQYYYYTARVNVWSNILHSQNLELFKYAHQRNVPFTSTTQQRSLCIGIASQHDKSLLKWAWDTWSLKENALAAKTFSTMFSIEFLEMLQDDGFDFASKPMTCLPSTWIFENLVYLYKLGCPWDPTIFNDYDSFMSVKYAYEHGCPWNPEILKRAAMTGNLRVLSYALTHGCPYNTLSLKQITVPESVDYIKHFIKQKPKQRCNIQ